MSTTTKNLRIHFQTPEQMADMQQALGQISAIAQSMSIGNEDESDLFKYLAARLTALTKQVEPLNQALYNVTAGFPEFGIVKNEK